ncbi:MAG: ribonuclease Z [Flavobacteriaceae bacterium]|nr:ribonuclease Z [Flavobacteriaceae bacterium]
MSIKLTILGCHSATPRINAFPTAQYLEINNFHCLIDCGEGTQRQIRKYKVGFSKFSHIFISHLHGDHFFGLIGLISTLGILGRERELHIFGPKGIEEVTRLQLKITQSHAKFPIVFYELASNESEVILDNDKVTVKTIPLDHRIYTNGYLFIEKEKQRNLNIGKIEKYSEITKADYLNLKAGRDFTLNDGTIIKNEVLTKSPKKPLRYAFCSDTAYKPSISKIIQQVDLLYHESTFLEDKSSLAKKTKHSTSKEAATIALKSDAKQLVLGHYSGRYKEIAIFKEEAQKVFKNTALAEPGKIFTVV